jgi:hypothetical protein
MLGYAKINNTGGVGEFASLGAVKGKPPTQYTES